MGASEKKAAGVSTLPLLPQDILVEILSKLPAKSLVRFRCVSKFFYALTVDHAFGVMHRSLSLTLPSRAGILIAISSSPAYYTINFSEQNPARPGMLQAKRLAYLDAEPFLKGSLLRSSSDGLICLSRPNGDVVVCNVSTGQRISLPRIQFHSPNPPSIYARLGFDSQSERYKVLMSTWMNTRGNRSRWSSSFEYKHWILTVGVDKSWREIYYSPHPFEGHGSLIDSDVSSVYIDGFIYSYNWLNKADPPSFHIVAFEVGSESCSLIPFPAEVSSSQQYHFVGYISPFMEECRALLRGFALLQVDGGRLAIVFVRKSGHLCYMDVWTWEKSKECWEKITMIIPLEESIDIPHRSLRYTTNHAGEIVLLCINRERFSILICNLKSEVWRQFDVGGVEEFPIPCPTDVTMYGTRDNVFSLE
nr:putative F-box protein At3g52320 [Ipomoea batatas]